jgi:hypothetical protein
MPDPDSVGGKGVFDESFRSRLTRTHDGGTLTVQVALKSPYRRTKCRISEMAGIKRDVCMIGGYAWDTRKENLGCEYNLRSQ